MSATLSVPAKRHRPCESGGPLCTSLSPTLEMMTVPLVNIVDLVNSTVSEVTDDEEHKEHLACPFWKHNPGRYLRVKNSCTSGCGFKNIGKLTEHIKRVHCLWNGCENCRVRFNKAKKEEVDEVKKNHMARCRQPTKNLTESDAEWMSNDQDEAYGRLNFQRDKGDFRQCYDKICRALWGHSPNEILEPYHLPGFEISVFRWKFMKNLELYRQRIIGAQHPDARQAVITAPSSPLFKNVDPALLSNQLSHLPNGPIPFFRGQRRKDSGVYSLNSSENRFAFPEQMLPEHACASDEDQTWAQVRNDDMGCITASTWTDFIETREILDDNFDSDAEGFLNIS
ncbi:hypothetical protein F5Y11DRAFT_330931 [Daldinia sp. FL1419]|nr:hypothetical protein F5Y11DRAFT_330931 [Daldinia sp. FL1419]